MAWLDFLKNGNELSELLIEGNNPYGARLLNAEDTAQMAGVIPASEQVQAYVLGRVPLAGRGLWLLTDQHLLMSEQEGTHAVKAFTWAQLSEVECQKGKYGYTLRVTAQGQRHSVYGTAAPMAALFYEKLGHSVTCAPMHKPPRLDADDLAQARYNFSDAAQRLKQGKAAAVPA